MKHQFYNNYIIIVQPSVDTTAGNKWTYSIRLTYVGGDAIEDSTIHPNDGLTFQRRTDVDTAGIDFGKKYIDDLSKKPRIKKL